MRRTPYRNRQIKYDMVAVAKLFTQMRIAAAVRIIAIGYPM